MASYLLFCTFIFAEAMYLINTYRNVFLYILIISRVCCILADKDNPSMATITRMLLVLGIVMMVVGIDAGVVPPTGIRELRPPGGPHGFHKIVRRAHGPNSTRGFHNIVRRAAAAVIAEKQQERVRRAKECIYDPDIC